VPTYPGLTRTLSDTTRTAPVRQLSRFSLAELRRPRARFSSVAGAERELDAAETQLGGALDDRLAFDAPAVNERPVRGGEVDEVPDGAATEERGVSTRDAVVREANVVLGASPD